MAKPWNDHRHTIVRLYINEGKTLQEVRAIMKSQYKFEASVRSYRQHFDQWRVGKYNCKKRMLRRRQSQANRPLLPSPPRTPVEYVYGSSPTESISECATIGASSPESIASTRRSSQHTPEQRPLPNPSTQQHRFMPFFEGNPTQELPLREKTSPRARGLDAMGPAPASVWDDELQVVLRDNGMAEDLMPPILDVQGVERKYLPPVTCPDAPSWDMVRSSTAPNYQLGSPGGEYYRLPYQDTVPRCLPDMFGLGSLARSGDYRPSLRTIPRLM
ncbi:Clr5 domain-containing protein [Ilyonectria sp. MPI-CAGE-AT-0026]|nr:Clr5 domain-containing protein [Ilyonectria sp. MPI-CAGE-AT-0026]